MSRTLITTFNRQENIFICFIKPNKTGLYETFIVSLIEIIALKGYDFNQNYYDGSNQTYYVGFNLLIETQ